jgi:hypothetical protein
MNPQAVGGTLWGGVPSSLLPLYGVSMLLATAGYFAFTYFLVFRLDPEEARIANQFSYGLFNGLYVLILVPSALWLPLTWLMLEQPGTALWIAIRLVLAIVGLAALGMLGALCTLRPRQPAWTYWLAVAGTIPFCVQTAVLDAIVWPAYF